MWLVWAGVILWLLWYFDIGYFGQMSGWWVVAPLGLAFVWFELFEKRLGLDKKAAHDEFEKQKQERLKRNIEKMKRGRR
jgi:small Trp-rich protein